MADENEGSFKFSADEEEPDLLYAEETKDLQIEKLSHRITMLAILLPCLIGVLFYIAYRDLSSRVARTQDTGALEVQNLSKDLQEKLNAFSDQYKALTDKIAGLDASLTHKIAAFDKRVATLDKRAAILKKNLAKDEKTLQRLAVSKADKKAHADAIAGIKKALAPIKKDLKALPGLQTDVKALSGRIHELEKSRKQQQAVLAARLDKMLQDLTRVQADIADLSVTMVDRDALQLELLKVKKKYRKDLEDATAGIEKNLAVLQEKINSLEKRSRRRVHKKVPAASSVKKSSSPGAGGIVEQNLKE